MNLDILQAIQSVSSPALDLVFAGLTMLGGKTLLAGLFCAVYWCWNKDLGKQLILSLCAGLCLNGLVKDIFQVARPFGQEGIVSKQLATATGYSFPSAHAQTAATFWWGCALWLSHWWAKAAAILVILGVGLSRLYLGVHYPTDVLGGLVLGFLTAWLFHRLCKEHRNRTILVLCILLATGALLAGHSADTVAAVAMTLGTLAGLVLEQRLTDFGSCCSLWGALRRLALGGAVAGAVYLPIKFLFPDSYLESLAIGLVAFWAVGAYPWLLVRLNL